MMESKNALVKVSNQISQKLGVDGMCPGKVVDASLAVHIKQKTEEMAEGLDAPLSTSIQDLKKRVQLESRGNHLAGCVKLASESGAALAHVLPVRQGTTGEKMEDTAQVKEVEEPVEALDLSLPKKKERSFKDRCVWITGEDSDYESSLLMEVDEIEDSRTEPEVEEDYESSCDQKNIHIENPHVSHHASLTTPPEVAVEEEVLLIDIEGVPYTLAPDGTKVPQMDPEDRDEEPDSTLGEDEDEPSSSSALTEIAHAKGRLTHAKALLEGKPSPKTPAQEVTTGFLASALKTCSVLSKQSQMSVLPTLSGLPSQPIQVVASSTSNNTPILLLSPSQLQTATASSSSPTSTTEADKGLMALSLPLALTQNVQSSPMILVLSSMPVSSAQSSVNQVPVLNTSSGQLPQISSIALPLASGLAATGSSVMVTNSPVAKVKISKSQRTTVSAEQLAGSSSSNAKSASHAKQASTAKTDDWTPKSFREALLRPDSVPVAETQSLEAPTTTCSSSSEDPMQLSADSSNSKVDTQTKPLDPSVPVTENTSQDEQVVSSSSPTPPLSPSASLLTGADQPPSSPTSGGPRRILYCRYCPRVFYYLSDLERHSITHSQSKPHVCALCGKAFKRSSHLERHKHIHTGQRNFACAICGKRFREAGELMRHQRVHTGEKPFQCSLCHMRFAERNTLRRHTKRKHQGREREAMEADRSAGGSQRPQSSPSVPQQPLVLVAEGQEESPEWYSSAVPQTESDSEVDRDPGE